MKRRTYESGTREGNKPHTERAERFMCATKQTHKSLSGVKYHASKRRDEFLRFSIFAFFCSLSHFTLVTLMTGAHSHGLLSECCTTGKGGRRTTRRNQKKTRPRGKEERERGELADVIKYMNQKDTEQERITVSAATERVDIARQIGGQLLA